MNTHTHVKPVIVPNLEYGARGGTGLQTIGDLFPDLKSAAPPENETGYDQRLIARRPWSGLHVTHLEPGSMAEELASRAQPVGPLLSEIQGQHDLRLAQSCARRLKSKIEGCGGTVNTDTEHDAAGAGVLALAQWRDGAGTGTAARLCWRAVERSISADTLGSSVEITSVGEDWLAAQIEPLAATLCGLDTRDDIARRWRAERARGRLASRVAGWVTARSGQSARRRELVDRIGRAMVLLLQGSSLDDAAEAVGFAGVVSQRKTAGDRLTRAVRAVVPDLAFDLRGPRGSRPTLTEKVC